MWVPRSWKAMPEPLTRSFTVLDTRTSPACANAGNPGANVHGDATDVLTTDLTLSGADHIAHRYPNPASAPRPWSHTEGRASGRRTPRETVAGVLYDTPLEPADFGVGDVVVACEQLAPT